MLVADQQLTQPEFMPGIFSGIPNAAYHADNSSYSSSIVKLMDVPAEARYRMDNPSEYKECYRIGSAIHKHILEPADFKAEFLTGIDCPRRSNADRHEWAQWFYANGGDGDHIVSHPAARWNELFEAQSNKHMVTPKEIKEIGLMAESVKSNANAIRLLEGGSPEQSVYWIDDETELKLRCRPDYKNSFCSDLKSCQSARPGAVSREIYNRGYHISAAMYTDGLLQATGDYHPFLFIFIEKTAPYLCAVYGIDDESKEYAWGEYRRLVTRLAECLDKGEWPGHEDNLSISLPAYAFR